MTHQDPPVVLKIDPSEWKVGFDDPDFIAVAVRDIPDLNAPPRLCFVQKHTLRTFVREELRASFGQALDKLITGPDPR